MHAALRLLRDEHFEWITIHENPRHIREGAPNERPVQDVPGVELDETTALAVARTRQRRHEPAQPLHTLGFGRDRAQQDVDGRRFGKDDGLTQSGQHLRHERGAATRPVKNKTGGSERGDLPGPLAQRGQRRLMAEQDVRRMLQTTRDGLVKKRIGETFFAHKGPVQPQRAFPCEQAERHALVELWRIHSTPPFDEFPPRRTQSLFGFSGRQRQVQLRRDTDCFVDECLFIGGGAQAAQEIGRGQDARAQSVPRRGAGVRIHSGDASVLFPGAVESRLKTAS